jgi:hypothetical protein
VQVKIGDGSYLSFQNFICSRLPSKSVKIKIYEALIILLFFRMALMLIPHIKGTIWIQLVGEREKSNEEKSHYLYTSSNATN